jgi:hypothetical protein
MKQFNEMSYVELVEYQTQVNEEVRQRVYYEGYKQGRSDEALDAVNSYYEQSQPLTRDETVEKAKRDVEEYTFTMGYTASTPYSKFNRIFTEPEFVVNREKRTVVVLVKPKFAKSGTSIVARGIAKCDPSDCFNVHIGKAIALRRALGIDVPSEYLNAPQPTEVRVGDVVGYPFDPDDNTRDIVVKIDGGSMSYEVGFDYIDYLFTDDNESEFNIRIIDDSRGGGEA